MHRPCPFDSGLTEPFGFGEPESRGLGLAFTILAILLVAARLRPEKQHFIPPGEAIEAAGDHKHGVL
jgi:hypothetical protein